MDQPANVYPVLVTEFEAGSVTNDSYVEFVSDGAVLPPAELYESV